MENSPPIFISHSSQDKVIAASVCAALEADGSACWIAPRNIPFGKDWSEAIVEAIAGCRVLILLFSSHANASVQVRREVQRAFEHGVTVIPIRIEDILPHPALEYYISSVHWLDAAQGLLPEHLHQLTTYIHKMLHGNEPSPIAGAVPVFEAANNLAVPSAVPLAVPSAVPLVVPPTVPASPSAAIVPSVVVPPVAQPAGQFEAVVAPPTNLPEPTTSFVGRENVLATVMRHMQSSRLLTLTGSGGSGKTRLALETASRLKFDFPDGTWLIELEALDTAELIGPSIAAALDIAEAPGRDIISVLTDALQTKKLLLVLDNAEHLLQQVTKICTALLRRCPHVRLLVTSQERLSLAGEQSYRVPTLSLPDNKLVAAAADPVAKAEESEAIQLFVARAISYRRDFALTRQNASVVASICSRLDGVPLAIELAAARVRSLSVEDIDSRLEDCFRLLTGGNRAALPRQQTLRAALDWSYDLLTSAEQILFLRLAVFAGSWTLESAEAVCSGDGIEEWEIIDVLFALGDKSLVSFEERDGVERYHMLKIVRLYALDKLSEEGQETGIVKRHSDYFGRFVAQANEIDDTTEQDNLIETEHDNLRIALESFLAQENATDTVKMCLGMAEFWWHRGWIPEAAHFLSKTLTLAPLLSDIHLQAGFYGALGWTAYLQANYSQAAVWQQNSLDLWQQTGDRAGEAKALNNLAVGAQTQCHFTEARDFYARSLDIWRQLNDEPNQAGVLSNLGLLSIHEGHHEEAREQLTAARLLYERNQDLRGAAISLCNLTDLALRTGECAVAKSMAELALQHFRTYNDRPGIAFTLVNLAEVAVQEGDGNEAVARTREAMRVSLEAGLRGLIPTSLDIMARAETLRDKIEAAYFCFVGAEKLRLEMHLPRLVAEEEQLEQLRSGPFTVLEESIKRDAEAKVSIMALESLVSAATRF